MILIRTQEPIANQPSIHGSAPSLPKQNAIDFTGFSHEMQAADADIHARGVMREQFAC